jgi:hypothetical protein
MMASWAPSLERRRPRPSGDHRRRRPERGVLRLGRHIVSDRAFALLAQRLGELEQELAPRSLEDANEDRETVAVREVLNAGLAQDLDLLSAAAKRSHLSAH